MIKTTPSGISAVATKLKSGLESVAKKIQPAPLNALELTGNLWSFQIAYTVADLGVLDSMWESPKTVGQLAEQKNLDYDSLYRLLRASANFDICSEGPVGTFKLSQIGKALCKKHPESPRDYLLYAGKYGYGLWGKLGECVAQGKCVSQLDESKAAQDPAELIARKRAAAAIDNIMIPSIVANYDFSKFEKIMDIGGGKGRFLATILVNFPETTGIVFEKPSVIEKTKHFIQESNLTGKCGTVSGDFFASIPGGANMYILRSILQDWSDEEAGKILKVVRESANNESKLLIIENIIPKTGLKDSSSVLDVEMMITSSGRKRSRAEFELLVRKSGFRLDKITLLQTGLSILEVVPISLR